MIDFFKKKNDKNSEEQVSDFLNVENSTFNTSAENQVVVDNPDYQNLVYHEPTYNIPKYKAVRNNNVDIVIDRNQLGFDANAINPNIKTVDAPNSDDSNMLVESIVIDDDNKKVTTNNNDDDTLVESIIVDDPSSATTLSNDSVEIIDDQENLKDVQTSTTVSNDYSIFGEMPSQTLNDTQINSNQDEDDEEKKFSIFGSNEGITNLNNYSNKNQYKEEKKELEQVVEYTKDGYKICPNCGAILNPSAPICFMCSKSFILKK